MKIRLLIAFIGNLIDTAATIYLTGLGYTEINPIMAPLLQWPALFASVKGAAMTAVLLWIWKRRGDRKASAAAWIASVVYGTIAVYYCVIFPVFL